jgi:tRNA dimethylallyltransferase
VDSEISKLEPLLVIVGPTASGKSHLALEAAEAVSGEIVSADAFAVYRGLDIGTDKPDADARRRIHHHLIDVVEPSERFSAGDFAREAGVAIASIRARGSTPILAGGSHFYVRAVLLGLFPAPPRDTKTRSRLNAAWRADPVAVYQKLQEVDPAAAARIDPHDRQRIVRALEVHELTGVALSQHWTRSRQSPRYRPMIAAPERPREELYARIDARVDRMFKSGLEEEVNQLLVSGIPPEAHALKAIGYRQVVEMLQGRWDRPTTIARTKLASRRLAKRQLTWLRSLSEGSLRWVEPADRGGTASLLALWHQHWGSRTP